ncbi:NAD(P)-binding protein [Atractiella rhizophila]|nr:NAD(P)-binding protein [Atractiella rhizophila]KAH8919183.1 NAD(P)-binding protein [Atractiella rhizophila]
MTLIRLAFVGLSAGGSWGTRAHLPYLQKSTKYAIHGLLNSTPESAKAAIQAFSLSPDTKIYSSPQDLADDSDVDLVVVSVIVDKHYDLVLPSLKKGKKAFVEWPLAKSLDEAQELVDVARKSGALQSSFVGLQGRFNPVVKKVKQLVEDGEVGKILSTTWNCTIPQLGPSEEMTERFWPMMQIESPSNFFTIYLGHIFDTFCATLGEWEKHTSIVKSTRPSFRRSETKDTAPKTVPDHVFVQGILKTGVLASFTYSGADIAPGAPALIWRIQGEKGEIEFTSPNTAMVAMVSNATVRIIRDRKAVDVVVDGGSVGLSPFATHVGAEYEDYASGGENVASFEVALARHKLLREIIDNSL